MNYEPEIILQIKQGRSKFIAMASTYFLGAFNDNFFKQAAMLMAVVAGKSELQGKATILFSLPFVLFSAYSGWMADRFSKRKVIIGAKFLELTAMIIGAFGIITVNWNCMLAMVFLMGLQSAIFGPALNGSIPELYPEIYVGHANAVVKFVSTAAILAGISLAGIVLDKNGVFMGADLGQVLVAAVTLLVALLGVMLSFGVNKSAPVGSSVPFPFTGPLRSLLEFFSICKDPPLFLAIIGDAFFYFLSLLAVLNINTFGLNQLGLTRTITSLLTVSLMIGICAGSFLAARIIATKPWTSVLFPASLGMGIGLLLTFTAPYMPESIRQILLFIFLFITGCCGGAFLIPVTSFIQIRPSPNEKGRIIAVSNFCSFSAMLIAGQVFIMMDHCLSPAGNLAVLGVFSILVSFCFLAMQKRKGINHV
ncbi:MAG: MFS transporter [Proteobacteria bacterium]|nr:MFS transporter [Pseudomonadota bacterium]